MTFIDFLDEIDPTHLLWERRRACIDAQIANRNSRHCHIGQISMKQPRAAYVLSPVTTRDMTHQMLWPFA